MKTSWLSNLSPLIGIAIVLSGCGQNKIEPSANEVEEEKKTQIVLKVQAHDYDDTQKTEISGAYVDKSKMTVPNSLSGQNKWFMFEGPVLENDKVAYRYYADYRHRIDIYGKKVPDLVMDTVSWDYHNIMDWGSDILKVGNSLGMGSPGIFYQDTIYTLSDWSTKELEIMEDGNNKSILRTTFKDLRIEEHSFEVIQDWSISAGNFWTEIHVYAKDGSLPEGMEFATGIVKHLPTSVSAQQGNAFYAYSYGVQSYHEEELGMAIMASKKYLPAAVENDLSHLVVFGNGGQGVKYRLMAQWKEGIDGPESEEEFKKKVIQSCADL